MRIFKRKIYSKMLEWKQKRDGSTALLIKGARRVGKSTIAKEFAKNEYESYIAIDFADAPAVGGRREYIGPRQFLYATSVHIRSAAQGAEICYYF